MGVSSVFAGSCEESTADACGSPSNDSPDSGCRGCVGYGSGGGGSSGGGSRGGSGGGPRGDSGDDNKDEKDKDEDEDDTENEENSNEQETQPPKEDYADRQQCVDDAQASHSMCRLKPLRQHTLALQRCSTIDWEASVRGSGSGRALVVAVEVEGEVVFRSNSYHHCTAVNDSTRNASIAECDSVRDSFIAQNCPS